MRKTIVVIHGVGNSLPGAVGRILCNTLNFNPAKETIVCSKNEILTEFTDKITGDSLIEVNWSDLIKPKNSVQGILRHLWFIFTGMLDIAVHADKGRTINLAAILRLLLVIVSPITSFLFICSAGAVCIEDTRLRIVVFVVTTALTILFSAWNIRQGRFYHLLWIWSVVVTIFSAYAIWWPLKLDAALQILLKVRTFTFGATAIVLMLAVFDCLFRKKPIKQRLADMALRYIPYIVMNGIFTWITFLGLGSIRFLSNVDKYDKWQKTISPNVDYGRIEGIATAIFIAIALLALIMPTIGYQTGRFWHVKIHPFNSKGHGAQSGFVGFLIVTPVLLLALAVTTAIVASVPYTGKVNFVEIYQVSIWRTFPYLVWAVGPFATVFDAMGDVIFYLQPNEKHPANIAKKCRERLKIALEYVKHDHRENVIILAHSQGSVITMDLSSVELNGYQIVTIGSPIQSLYSTFLGKAVSQQQKKWDNLLLDGDVLAGEIPYAKNHQIGNGGHTEYWEQIGIKKYLR